MIDDIVITDPNRNFGKPMFAVVGAPIVPVLERLLAGCALTDVAGIEGAT